MFIIAFHLIKFVYTSLQMPNKKFTVTSINVYIEFLKKFISIRNMLQTENMKHLFSSIKNWIIGINIYNSTKKQT